MNTYLFCASRSWSLSEFLAARPNLAGQWGLCVSADDLQLLAERLKPRYIFFPHWSSYVPVDILEKYECVCFHMTDVPYGRGGSPLQNLIVRGHKSTMLTALRMTQEFDAGPVYFKRPMSLNGTAEKIFSRASRLSMQMLEEIVVSEPTPEPQSGKVEAFPRRKAYQSEIPATYSVEKLYDHIRMLDAPGYPPAFAEFGEWVANFSDAEIGEEFVEARVRFKKKNRMDEK